MVDNSNSMAQEQANLTRTSRSSSTVSTEPGPSRRPCRTCTSASSRPTWAPAASRCRRATTPSTGTTASCATRRAARGGLPGRVPVVPVVQRGRRTDRGPDERGLRLHRDPGDRRLRLRAAAQGRPQGPDRPPGRRERGLLRDDSLLSILIVTDEEDCSVREDAPNASDIFNTQLQLGPLNLRCFNHRDQYVEPVQTYVRDSRWAPPSRRGSWSRHRRHPARDPARLQPREHDRRRLPVPARPAGDAERDRQLRRRQG